MKYVPAMCVFSSCLCIFFIWLKMQMAQTPLHVSAGHNKAEIVKSLLEWPGNDKVELEAQNMVSIIYVIWHCLM